MVYQFVVIIWYRNLLTGLNNHIFLQMRAPDFHYLAADILIFVAMANKLKKAVKTDPEKKTTPTPSDLKADKEQAIDWKGLARDERTRKIAGTLSLLTALFLFISFVSYFFTWEEDQSIAGSSSILFNDGVKASNLLGRLGAFASHFFISNGFGIASLFICTFFFVVGVNLLFNRKVFSIWRNLKYVTIGMLVVSVILAFAFQNLNLWFGGAGGYTGRMISDWLTGMIGNVGTGALLFVLLLGYIIWQFNPSFDTNRKTVIAEQPKDEMITEPVPAIIPEPTNGNYLKKNGTTPEINIVFPDGEELKLVEKAELPVEEKKEEKPGIVLPLNEEKHTVLDLKSEKPFQQIDELVVPEKLKPAEKKKKEELPLEIKTAEKIVTQKDDEPLIENMPPYEPTLDLRDYKYPTLDLLENYGSERIVQDANELENNKNQIISTLRNYDIEIQRISATVGPTVTLYEIIPAAGVRISRIKNLEDDIALSLAALGIRIIAPIPGKGTIGIEVPNAKKSIVSMKTLLGSEKFQHNNYSLPIAIGKKIDNENYIVDLASMPHLLMAGATGQGKSVGINALLVSLLYKKHPSQLKFVLIDPKKVELSIYRAIENHFLAKLPGEEEAIITDTKKVVHTLNALCIEMDNRYDLLKEAGARNIKEYNEKFIKRRLNPEKGHQYLPFIVLVIDEFADLIMTAGKEIEMPIARLAQLSRAVGIHLIIATQRPSVNIITGTIKANFPARIAFKVSSKIDSRTILDTGGADQLIGKGDMLISHHGEVTRLQCVFVDTPEVDAIVNFIGDQRGYPQPFLLPEYVDEKELEGKDFDLSDRDSLFDDAARLIVSSQMGSTSLLQRRMKLGYNRAGRLMDQLEAAGVVGPNLGSKAREVLIKTEADLQQHLALLG
jgi:S-DNA-T family DNA segregation ATPase FtsK/SpoIIIE